MTSPLDVKEERNHIRTKLSAVEKFNSLLGRISDIAGATREHDRLATQGRLVCRV
jgi:hypothetical protein